MTHEEKETIKELRLKGCGYGKIAKNTGIKLDTVKSYCRRHGLGGNTAELLKKDYSTEPDVIISRCKNCGAVFVKGRDRKKKLFCSTKCCNQWWSENLDQSDRKKLYETVCQNCGKVFYAYTGHGRKYCSHECYIKHRFG